MLGSHINQVFLQLGTDIVQKILFNPALRQLVMECAQIYIGAATAVAQVFFITVSWIGFEGRFERGAAVRAAKQAGEEIDSFRPLSLLDGFMAKNDTFPVLTADVGGAVVFYALEGAGVDFISGGTGPGTIVAGDAIFLAAIHSRFSNGIIIPHIVPEILNDWGCLGIFDAALHAIDHLRTVAIGPLILAAGEAPFLAAAFAVEDKLNALTGAVRFIFRDGEHDIHFQTPVGGGGVVVLHGSLPGDVIGFQNFLDFVVLPDIAEPAVQLDKENAVNFPGLDIGQQLLHDGPLHSWLPGTVAFVPVDPHDLEAVICGVLNQNLLLGL